MITQQQHYDKSRYPLADLMKGFAVIMMIQVHIIELFATENIYYSPLGKFLLFLGGPPAAPLFMVVMGYFLAESKKTISKNIFRGIKLIALGILLNAGINLHLFITIISGKADLNPMPFLLGADILPLAGLSIIVISLIKKFLPQNLALYLAILLAFILFSEYINRLDDSKGLLAYMQAFFYGHLDWSYFPLFPWIVYPFAGVVFRLVTDKMILDDSRQTLYFVASCIVTITTLDYGIATAANLKEYYHHNWIYTFWTLQVLVIITYLSQKIVAIANGNILVRYVRWLGRNVTMVYVFQWLLIGNIATAIFRSQELIMSLLWFILILFFVSVLTYQFSRDKSFT